MKSFKHFPRRTPSFLMGPMCGGGLYVMKTPEERFQEKLGAQDPASGCVEWMAGRDRYGYGRVSFEGRDVGSHRLAWILKRGPIPEGMCVLHSCDNPACCNEDHLFLGTNADNSADMALKGRHGRAKLTAKDIPEIRKRLAMGDSLIRIGADFGVNRGSIHQIKTGKCWSHA
jgi:hypothetical protein